MEPKQKEKNLKILVVAVLGRKNEDVYENRIFYSIEIIKKFIDIYQKIHLFAKDYNNKFTYSFIKGKLEIKSNNIKFYKSEEETKFFRNGIYSYDTIEEAAMLRLCIEKLFKNKTINLMVVTSDFHSERADWIFDSLYKSLEKTKKFKSKIIPISLSDKHFYISSSVNSKIEIDEKCELEEQRKIQKQLKEFSKYNDFFEYYKGRKITFGETEIDGVKHKRDDKGKNELISFIKENSEL
jgi:hypothetical protein